MGNRIKRAIVAMSGGVDSSVAAALLVEQGYDVFGITLNVWPRSGEGAREDACCALSAVEDARRVADKLGIPHYTLNVREVFDRTVIADFVSEYRQGRTPNPCLRCNEHIKFAALLGRASGLAPDFVATGHYARVERGSTGRMLLRKGRDIEKDQSYVLYVLRQEVLARTILPLGDLTKAAVRDLARHFGLSVAQKPESQEICFVEDNDYGRFLRERDPRIDRPGPILDREGRAVGQHRGIAHYTIGQRRGLGLPGPSPRFVIAIDAPRNAVVVGGESELLQQELVAEGVNLISLQSLPGPLRVAARIRYRAAETSATLVPMSGNRVKVHFDRPLRAIAPGQAVVFYQGDLVVGGGTIASRDATSASPRDQEAAAAAS